MRKGTLGAIQTYMERDATKLGHFATCFYELDFATLDLTFETTHEVR